MPEIAAPNISNPQDSIASFSERVLVWFDRYGRHDLPWQENKTAYRVWISEIMLQQTQVATVTPYFQRFMERFPDAHSLASADLDEVLQHWSGLGYYARARNLHKAAQKVCQDFQGQFPTDLDSLSDLPGIGRSTAGAILSIAMRKRAAILDGNVKRVLARHDGIIGWPGDSAVLKRLWEAAEAYTPDYRVDAYSQAMMDLGATLCTPRQPQCLQCPIAQSCVALEKNQTGEIPGSKPKKSIPKRYCQLLLIENSNREIYLERRPPTGIWGGLWSLPQEDSEQTVDELQRIWEQQLGGELEFLETLADIKHTFSHFQLWMRPQRFRLIKPSTAIREDGHIWQSLDSKAPGLPAPIKAMLKQLTEAQQLQFQQL